MKKNYIFEMQYNNRKTTDAALAIGVIALIGLLILSGCNATKTTTKTNINNVTIIN